jgi:nitronate monooxygenase
MLRKIVSDKKLPFVLIQGEMGVKISGPNLAAAVANEGGIGVIGAPDIGADEPDFFQNPTAANKRALRKAIRETRKLTSGIFGVNIMVAMLDFSVLVQVAIEEDVDFIFVGAGISFDMPNFLKQNSHTKLVPIISSKKAAKIIVAKWIKNCNYVPDAFVVEGPEAGGHLGFKVEQLSDSEYALEKLVPQVIEVLRPYQKNGSPIPVIAAGGIYTGADIHKFLQLGASGVQMATRFVVTHECDASNSFKEAYIKANQEDIIIIKSPVGMPGRAISNKFLDAVTEGEKIPFNCPCRCLETCDSKSVPYCISLALINAYKGNLEKGFVFAGTNAYRSKKIISVKELIETLVKEYEAASLL